MINATAQRLLEDEKQFNEMYEDLLVDRLQEEIEKAVTINPKPIDREAFNKVLEEAREAARAAQMQNVEVDGEDFEEHHDHDHEH